MKRNHLWYAIVTDKAGVQL